jgi:small subunit ribosomal protein S6
VRRYELMLLLRPDLEDDKLQAAVEKVTRAIVNGGGSLSKVSPWGKRRLAYDINRHREASYFLIHFDIEPAQVREIERGMLISEEILRHLVTVLEDRGPADELAPAAAARSADGDVDDDFDADEAVPAVEGDLVDDAELAAGAGVPEGELDAPEAEPAPPEPERASPALEAEADTTTDDEAEDVPAAEERARA